MIESAFDRLPLGLFGGTFDPVHHAHLRLAEEARESLQLGRVDFIPAGVPPHRDAPGSSSAHRLEMVRRAVHDNSTLGLDDSEVFSEGKSYTVLTLERLRAQLGPQQPLVLILGADAFQGLPKWHRWSEILTLAHIAVANRPGYAPHERRWPGTDSNALEQMCSEHFGVADDLRRTPAGRIVSFDMTPLAISASLIRDLIRTGRSVRYLLPDSVLDYIAEHSLYREPDGY